eukprot:gnl/Dysnectes_brevis/1973_a2270_1415.p1 GENE.gnl/Dysnectes_brevis/1973_a2270_1415~~gnl/Dysnectes_brevis/1973_a2270_1415.p1  ORF type:complete len:475 (-),score=171.45 gnl/Dysnectes_brevis/1973_a2270_1415:27-1451(-)
MSEQTKPTSDKKKTPFKGKNRGKGKPRKTSNRPSYIDLFQQSALVISSFLNHQGGLRTLVYASNFRSPQALLAISFKTLQLWPHTLPIVTSIIPAAKDLPQHQLALLMVLIGEYVADRKISRGSGRDTRSMHKVITQHGELFKPALAEVKANLKDILTKGPASRALEAKKLPRFVRVDLTKWSRRKASKTLQKKNELVKYPPTKPGTFALDPLVPDVLVFPPGSILTEHPFVTDGRMVLQSRASSLTVHAARPYIRKGTRVLDVCAAPGSKSLHAASLGGSVVANDRSEVRAQMLRDRVAALKHGDNVQVVVGDALELSDDEAQVIIVDPSCSSSGVAGNVDRVLGSTAAWPGRAPSSKVDVEALASFQTSCLGRALTVNPSASVVVYSTCSVHRAENEGVVEAVLADEAVQAAGWKLTAAAMDWPMRGDLRETVRCGSEMGSDGFFVALFTRGDVKPVTAVEEEESEEEKLDE